MSVHVTENDELPNPDDITRYQWDFMLVADEGDAKIGTEIKWQLDARYGKETTHARLYTNIADLVEMGLIEKIPQDERSNICELTDKGRAALQERREWFTGGDGE